MSNYYTFQVPEDIHIEDAPLEAGTEFADILEKYLTPEQKLILDILRSNK